MAEGKPRSTDPPRCKTCGFAHKGTCAHHDARGAISMQLGEPSPKRPMIEGTARKLPPLVETHSLGYVDTDEARGTRVTVTPATKLTKARKALTEAEKRGRGRPKTIKDMKSYKAQKARERRAAKKGKP